MQAPVLSALCASAVSSTLPQSRASAVKLVQWAGYVLSSCWCVASSNRRLLLPAPHCHAPGTPPGHGGAAGAGAAAGGRAAAGGKAGAMAGEAWGRSTARRHSCHAQIVTISAYRHTKDLPLWELCKVTQDHVVRSHKDDFQSPLTDVLPS